MEFLLTHDQLDPNVQNNFGDTALMMAVKFEATECVELLISDKQTEFNLKNNFSHTLCYCETLFCTAISSTNLR